MVVKWHTFKVLKHAEFSSSFEVLHVMPIVEGYKMNTHKENIPVVVYCIYMLICFFFIFFCVSLRYCYVQ